MLPNELEQDRRELIGEVGLGSVEEQHAWTTLPRQTSPGSELPLAALATAQAAVWLVYLHKSARVRAMV